MPEQLTVMDRPSEQAAAEIGRVLAIGYVGDFDNKGYRSSQLWQEHLSRLDIDVQLVDIHDIPGAARLAGETKRGPVYDCRLSPEDSFNHTKAIIDRSGPRQIVLFGYAGGAEQATRNALALSLRGYPIAGVVCIAPTAFMGKANPLELYGHHVLPVADGYATKAKVELHETTPLLKQYAFGRRRLSCLRHDDVRDPRHSRTTTFRMSDAVLYEHLRPFTASLAGHRLQDWRHTDIGDLFELPEYTLPTAFVACGQDEFIPVSTVRSFADRTRHADAEFIIVPNAVHDFRRSHEESEEIAEVVAGLVGQLATLRAVQNPWRAINRTASNVGSVEVMGIPTIPPGAESEAHIIIPDDVVVAAAQFFGLTSEMSALDNMCGYATIPRVLGQMGLRSIGVELDSRRYAIADRMAGEYALILPGDFRKVLPRDVTYDCIFTGLPWDWFRNQQTMAAIEQDIFPTMYDLLNSSGQLLVDSTYRVVRDEKIMPVSTQQAAYLAGHGFRLTGILELHYTAKTYEADTSLILQFRKR